MSGLRDGRYSEPSACPACIHEIGPRGIRLWDTFVGQNLVTPTLADRSLGAEAPTSPDVGPG